MVEPDDLTPQNNHQPPSARRWRYRYRAGQPLHSSDQGPGAENARERVPCSPQELMAMQAERQPRPDKPKRGVDPLSPGARQVLDLITALNSSPLEQQQIALSLVRRLEGFHDAVVEEMQQNP